MTHDHTVDRGDFLVMVKMQSKLVGNVHVRQRPGLAIRIVSGLLDKVNTNSLAPVLNDGTKH